MTTAIALISLVISIVAVTINLSGLMRRPRIVAEWAYVQEAPPFEGLSIIEEAIGLDCT